ncbi:UV DNA damage repair endonuclease UvsE [Cohnella faecalis]|uniref:UV DNA damage repair endonuclease UvsE n=1 Tax=Cohnella faecalis TaxID=2315694 RepID=A0A398CTM8_9BACL|nr:UV DNA damage repair endonuclease UvsE [Cohnella faecalis]RIE02324.1 UV DNA damage repair endonuclease UvsE [Cohnella faecalis]
MLVRFGYVAMTMQLENASPSRTMTLTNFVKLPDREAALRRLERLAEENLHNTLRILKHNRYMDIRLYRFTSKFIPLKTHERLSDWNPYPVLADAFAEVGVFVRENGVRTSFHPDHFTVLSTPREEVLANSIKDLEHHVSMLELMGLDERSTCNIHVGGSYGDKEKAGQRFVNHFRLLEPRIAARLTVENDDKTFTALETLNICESTGAPMVLDIHHHAVNPGEERMEELWPRIKRTWDKQAWNADPGHAAGSDKLPPKIHVSSPKSASDPRGHADYVDPGPLMSFMLAIAGETPAIDVMIEAKRKDEALFKLMDDLRVLEAAGGPVKIVDGASVEIMA